MAERRLQGLQRVLGVNALFATAYGNVGSSIYYALGLVAGLALGLTPLVFVITGIFFFCTAATYAEATAMPTAAETKFWTASPAICVKYVIVVSPP
jgi:APA family basic amino acid/polyamine antiporter